MKNFNVIEYIEEVRGKKGVKQRHLAKLINCTESNYSNKVFRKMFSVNEIFTLCDELGINLDNVKDTSCMGDCEVDDIINLLLSGRLDDRELIFNSFEKIKKFLTNKVLLDSLEYDKKFSLGYGTMVVASRSGDNLIREVDCFLEKVFEENINLDLDYISGLLFGCFFNTLRESNLSCCIILKYFDKVINYILHSYTEESVLYVMRNVLKSVELDKDIKFMLYDSGDCIDSKNLTIDRIKTIINEIVSKYTRSALIEHEFCRLNLLISYSYKVSENSKHCY